MLKLEDRFAENVERSDGCWTWKGGKSPRGYGKIEVCGRSLRAHRLAYELFVGPIPTGLMVCHTCDNPSCVRPDHLFAGTGQENTDDKVRKGRQARGEAHYARTSPEKLARGDRHGLVKLSDAQVREIRDQFTGARGQIIGFARSYGVSRDLIHKVVHNKARKSVSPGPDVIVSGWRGPGILDQ